MADTKNSATKSRAKRAAFAAKMQRLKKKKLAKVQQAVNSQTTSEATIDSTEASQEVPLPVTNGAAPAAATPPQAVEAVEPKPKEPKTNAWEKTKKASSPQQTLQSNGRPKRDNVRAKPATNGHAPLTIPTRQAPARQAPARPTGVDRSQLFARKAPQQQPRQQPQPQRRLGSRVSVQDRLKNKHLIESMPEDYVARDYSRRPAPTSSPRREEREREPVAVRPTGPRPESKRLTKDRPKNGRPLQNGSGYTPSFRQEAPPRTTTRSSPRQPRQKRMNGTTRKPPSTASTTSTPSRSTRSSSSSKRSSSTPTSSSISSPVRRQKRNLREHGMRKVQTKGKRIIKKQSAVWLNSDISDPEKQPMDSKLNPEAPLFESTAILTETGGFLNDDYYRQPTGIVAPMQPIPPSIPVVPQPVTPTEPDFSQAANNIPSYNQPQPPFHDMFGAEQYYSNYAYPMYSTDATGAYSGAGSQYRLNGMTSGTTSGSTSTQDLTQMIPPTHVPNGVHTNGSVAVVNGGAAGQGPSGSSELTGVSSSAVSEQSGVNASDPSMGDSFNMNMYDSSAFYAATSAMGR